MPPPLAQPRITPAQYLALERASATKNELINGCVHATASANRWHNLIVGNMAAEIHAQLHGRACEVYANDMRVKVARTELYSYPDVTALCAEPVFEDEIGDTLLNPSVIVEVLSDSTEKYDRGEKFAHYRRLDSLEEYVLVAQDVCRVEHYARHGDSWVLTELSDPAATLRLSSIDCSVPLADVYERVDVAPSGPLGS